MIERDIQSKTCNKQRCPRKDQDARVDLLHQQWHQWIDKELRYAKPDHHLPDLGGIVAVDLGEVDRQDICRAVQTGTDCEIGDTGKKEIALGEKPQINKWVTYLELGNDSSRKADNGCNSHADDKLGAEPIFAIAFFEKSLEAAQSNSHENDAEPISFGQELELRLRFFEGET